MSDSILNPNTPLNLNGLIYLFLIGFLPGFYITYIFLVNKRHHYILVLLISLVVGFVSGLASIFIIISSYSANPAYGKSWFFLGKNLPYFIYLEILIILIHFFYFRKRKPKAKKK